MLKSVFSAIDVTKGKNLKSLYIYQEYVGEYKDVEATLNNITTEIGSNFYPKNLRSAIYYDDPDWIKDKSLSRAVCGLKLQPDEKQKAEQIVKANPKYKLTELPEIDCIRTFFPYVNSYSYWLLYFRAYPAVREFGYQQKIFEDRTKIKVFQEIYHFPGHTSEFELVFPYGKELEGYILTTKPQPPYKPDGPMR